MSLGIGESFLVAGLQQISRRLGSPQVWGFFGDLLGGPKVEEWKQTLSIFSAMLRDAEMKQIEDTSVKDWLSQVHDLVYDMEDMLDKIVTKELQHRARLQRHRLTGRIQNSFPNVVFNYNLRSRIDKTTSRLNRLVTLGNALHLVRSTNEGPLLSDALANQQRPESSSVPNESEVFGRDKDIAAVLNMVFRVEANDQESDHFDIIGIVGMTGIGKTTLAKEVYNHTKVHEDFHLYAWVHVSHDFNPERISREILESSISSEGREKFDRVQRTLQDIVSEKKFLLVLDDVWGHNHDSWLRLKSPFRSAAPGSKIIITTQNEEVARGMGSSQLHVLDTLEDAACLSLLRKHAFYNNRYVNMEDQIWMYPMTEEVVKRCGGLPLAAIALGDVLRSKQNRDQWLAVLHSRIWDLPAETSIHTAFKVIYYDLSSYLKRCFAYCSIFPKSYQFKERELIFLWMAEGLIEQPEDNRTLEELGSEYFQDLVSRSIFRQASNDGPKFLMHDLFNDLAGWASRETTFRLEDESTDRGQFRRLGKARHLSYTSGEFDGKNKYQVLLHGDEKQLKCLRTFLPIVLDSSPRYISHPVLFDMLRKLKRLRVLSLERYCISMLPDSIGDMTHLRYLNLFGCLVRRLPKSATALYNLQTLILRNCRYLEELPSDIEKLSNLLHLDIRGATSISEMPPGIKELTSLRMLSDFIIGRNTTGARLRDLKDLKLLRGELHISKLEEAVDYKDARDVLRHSQDLKVLELNWGSQSDNSKSVLDMLRPHECIEKLTIIGYGGSAFSSWFEQSQLSNLAILRLEGCKRCTSLPPLGLLRSLKSLSIIRMPALESIGPEFYGSDHSLFQSLESLDIVGLIKWAHWDPINGNEAVRRFSRLRRLAILNCPVFCEQLPDNLPWLEELEIKDCLKLTVTVDRLPSLRKLTVFNCLKLVIPVSELPNLSELNVHYCQTMVCSGSSAKTRSLQSLTLSTIFKFENLSIRGFQQVRSLEVFLCEEFMEMLRIMDLRYQQPSLTFLTLLTELKIYYCSKLVTFPEVHFLFHLRKLEIESCEALSYLSEGIQSQNGCLEHLTIASCSSVKCIFRNQLPSSLKQLSIKTCWVLEYVLDDSEGTSSASASSSFTHLEYLSVHTCSSFTGFSSSGQLPAALKRIEISRCLRLGTLLSSGQLLPDKLEHIDIKWCTSLKSIVERFNAGSSLTHIRISYLNLNFIPEGLHNLGCLQEIIIDNCHNLEALPVRLHTLNSLEKLEVRLCQNITHFPDQGLPTSITSLTIEDLARNFYHQMNLWGFHRLASLTYLSIGGWLDAVSFPHNNMKLPTSLTHLIIKRFPKLERLSARGFLHLTFLEYLQIECCPKFKSLPKNGLPSSILQLRISNCLLRKKMFERGKGKYWCQIAFIPYIEIDKQLI